MSARDLPAFAQSSVVLVGVAVAGVEVVWGASRRQLEEMAGLLRERWGGVCVVGWDGGSVWEGWVSGCVLIGLRRGREIPDCRLTGRLAVSELAPGALAGSDDRVVGGRYFIDGGGLVAADVTEAPELP